VYGVRDPSACGKGMVSAGEPPVGWGEALFHASAGAPLAVLGLVLFVREVRRL
jgi:hypothetical protein